MSATPNPSQVMSTLRMLGDKELAQYASMHKKDPYIFPLAFQESNLRKQMRAQGAAGAAPQGPQPPVNDQALQTMAPQPLPEDVGLGRIAPPGVANMAGGGIVGFAGGGSNIENVYAVKAREDAEMASGTRTEYSPGLLDIIAQKEGRGAEATKAANRYMVRPGKAVPGPASAGLSGYEAERAKNMTLVNDGRDQWGVNDPRILGGQPPAIAPVPEAKPGVPPAAGGLGALSMGAGTSMSLSQRGGAMGAGADAGPPVSMPTRKETDYNALFDKAGGNSKDDPFAKETADIVSAENAAAKTRLEGQQGIAAEQGKLYDKQEGRLNERSAGLEKEGKRNEAMSWITAGLEMMQARGPGLSAIAGGAQKGFTQYAAGLEKLKAAQERIDEAADKVAEARLGSKKEQLGAQSEYDKALIAGRRETVNSVRAAYGINQKKAEKLVELGAADIRSRQELDSREAVAGADRRAQMQMAANRDATSIKVAGIGAAASGSNKQLEYLRAVAGDPALMAAHKAMESKGVDPAAGFVKFFSELPDYSTGKGLSKASPINQVMSQWLGVQAGLGGGNVPKPIQGTPGGAKVRD